MKIEALTKLCSKSQSHAKSKLVPICDCVSNSSFTLKEPGVFLWLDGVYITGGDIIDAVVVASRTVRMA